MKTNIVLIISVLLALALYLFTGNSERNHQESTENESANPRGNKKLIKVVTEDWRPYSYAENDIIKGLATKIVRKVLSESSVSYSIKLYPWARSYTMALHDPNVLIFAIVRTKEREKLFKWVGPVAPADKVYFYKLKSRTDIKPDSIEDLKNLRIGTNQLSDKHAFLQKNKFKNITLISQQEATINQLVAGRIDLVIKHENNMGPILAKANISKDQLEMVLLAFESKPYMAFSIKTPDDLVEKVRKSYLKYFSHHFKEKFCDK